MIKKAFAVVVLLASGISGAAIADEGATLSAEGSRAQAPDTTVLPASVNAPSPAAKPAAVYPGFTSVVPAKISAVTLVPGGKCSIDRIDGQAASGPVVINVSAITGIAISGWAFDDKSSSVPDSAFVQIVPVSGDATLYAPLLIAVKRADVAHANGDNSALVISGFNFHADPASVPLGQYAIGIVLMGAKQASVCTVPVKMDME